MCIIYLYMCIIYLNYTYILCIMLNNSKNIRKKISNLSIDGNCNIYDSNNHLDYILQTSEHVYSTHKSYVTDTIVFSHSVELGGGLNDRANYPGISARLLCHPLVRTFQQHYVDRLS